MQYTGEILALGVAMLWTATALCFEYSGKKMGTLPLNLIRIFMAFVMLGTLLLCTTGSILPLYAGGQTWLWLSVSGLIGFVIGDYFLFYSYILIGSRFTQLLMTLAPPASAIGGALILGESMGLNAIAGMIITITGIILSIVGKKDKIDDKNQRSYGLKLPTKGLLLAIGAGLCQGIGIVFSKLGLNYYSSDLTSHFSVFPDSNHEKIITDMIPFASSQIRLITGLVGFAILRSEEHTSELQSRDSNSYAVFCLKNSMKKDSKYSTQPSYI